MSSYSEEHLRRRKQYQKAYMQKYRAKKHAERAAKDPAYALRSEKWRRGHEKLQQMTDLQRELHFLEQCNASTRRKEKARVDARCAVDIDYAVYVAKWRAGRAECDKMTDEELSERRRRKQAEYSREYRKRTKQAAQSRVGQLRSEQTLSEPAGCSAEL